MAMACKTLRAGVVSRLVRLATPAALLLSLSGALGGCGLGEWASNGFKVGPNYKKPEAATASAWMDYQQPAIKSAQTDLSKWWGIFNDPVLNSLVDEAAKQNLSLKGAGERIVEARARRGITVGNLFPQTQNVSGSYSANKVSQNSAAGFPNEWFQNWDAGFNVSWEMDLWGRFRRAIEAADADLDASVADFDNVLVVLLADVSANYVQYRTFEERIAVARHNVEIQEKSYQLTQDKFNAGASTERDTQQSKQVLEQTRALIPQLEAGQRAASNALCVLLGKPPQDLAKVLGTEHAKIPTATAEIAIGIPADLLRRRPDVRAIERRAASQSAIIGIAKSDLYPRLSLDGSIGVQAENFGDLFHTPGSVRSFVGPVFQWNILNYGRIENAVAIQEARFRQLVLAYQDTVLKAGREAEDAVIGFLKSQERAKYLDLSVAAADRTVQISRDQYQEGVIDFTPVFLFEGTLAEQQDALAVARGNIALSVVDLYRALGGGWEMRLANGSATTQPATTQPTASAR